MAGFGHNRAAPHITMTTTVTIVIMTMFRRLDLPGFFFAMDISYTVQAAIYIDDVFIGIWQSVFHNATAVDYRTCCKVKRFCWIDI
jgi:hypothetical protein